MYLTGTTSNAYQKVLLFLRMASFSISELTIAPDTRIRDIFSK